MVSFSQLCARNSFLSKYRKICERDYVKGCLAKSKYRKIPKISPFMYEAPPNKSPPKS